MQSGTSDYELNKRLSQELNLIFHDLKQLIPIIEKIDIKALQNAKVELRSSLLSAAAQSNEAWRTHTSVDLNNLKSILEKNENIIKADIALSKLRQLNGTLLMIEAVRARKILFKEVQDLCNDLSYKMQNLFQQRLDIHKYITEEEEINYTEIHNTLPASTEQKANNTQTEEKPESNVSEEQKEKPKDVSEDILKQFFSNAVPHQCKVYKPEEIVPRLAAPTRNPQSYVYRPPQVANISGDNKRKAEVVSNSDNDPRKKSKQTEVSKDIESNFDISHAAYGNQVSEEYASPASTSQTTSSEYVALSSTLFYHSQSTITQPPVSALSLLDETFSDAQADNLGDLVTSILDDPTLLNLEDELPNNRP